MMRRAVRGRCSVFSSEGRRVGRRNEAVPQCRTHGATAECVCIEPRRNEGGAGSCVGISRMRYGDGRKKVISTTPMCR